MHFLLNDNYHCFSDTTAKNTLSYLQFASAWLSFFSLKVELVKMTKKFDKLLND